ncbi:MAG: cobalt transporter CbiM [Synergistaceae bacterium]|jgi:cobalt/nickel transport system permease protein|nr:cobalt transporter CbiM [Synergistaceae bacterium]
MHISEGFLSPSALAAGWAIAGAGVAWGLKKMDSDRIVRVSMASSVFFLASLINVKLGPSSTHLSLIGPIGLILGWTSFPAIFTALLLQAVLFQFGGLLVLGANTASMATPAVLAYLVFGAATRSRNLRLASVASFAAGFLAVMTSALLVGLWLALSDPDMMLTAKTIFAVHVPLAVVEGVTTLFMTMFLRRAFPDMLKGVDRL